MAGGCIKVRYKLLEVTKLYTSYLSNANERVVLILASRRGSLAMITFTLDSFYIDFGVAKLRFILCYAS